MEEENDPEKRAQLIQRIREGSKKIKKMDRGRLIISDRFSTF